MTDIIVQPGDVCVISRDSDIPTGFQIACETLGIRPVEESFFTNRPEFVAGWEAGVENNLVTSMPADSGPKEHEARRSWLLGFISGQVAFTLDYGSAFCNTEGHNEECERYTHEAPGPNLTPVDDVIKSYGHTRESLAVLSDEETA